MILKVVDFASLKLILIDGVLAEVHLSAVHSVRQFIKYGHCRRHDVSLGRFQTKKTILSDARIKMICRKPMG